CSRLSGDPRHLHSFPTRRSSDLEYLRELLNLLVTKIDGNKEALDGHRFLDWPSSENKQAIHAGLQALMVMALDAGAELSRVLGRSEEHTSELQSRENLVCRLLLE